MAKFFTSAKLFVRNIVHFLIDELCTSRMFRLTSKPKELEIITMPEERKLWTIPKTSVRLMSSCQHFCMQSRQYLFIKPFRMTAVRSYRNLIFRRYCNQGVNLPVTNLKDKEKLKDEKVIKHNEISTGDDPECKDHKSNTRNIVNPTLVSVKDLNNDENLLENNLYNSTQDVEIVGCDDVVNLTNDNVNRLPLNLQNLINEVEIETQVYSDLLNDTYTFKTAEKPSKQVAVIAPLKVFKPTIHKISDLNITKNNSILIPVSNNSTTLVNAKNKLTKLDNLKKLVESVNHTTTESKVPNKKLSLDLPNTRPLPKLSIKEIQNLAKKMCDKHVVTIKSDSSQTFKKPIIVMKSKPEKTETTNKISINKPHIVDGFSHISTVQLPKVDLQHNPVIVDRKNRLEMIKKTLENVKTVPMDSADEIKTMSSAMLSDPKAPTLLSIARRNRYNIGEGVSPPNIKPLPFRITQEMNKNIKEQSQKNDDKIDTTAIQQGVLTSEDIRNKFNPLASTRLQRPGTVPLYASNTKRQVSSLINKAASEEKFRKSRLPLPKRIIQKTIDSKQTTGKSELLCSVKPGVLPQVTSKITTKENTSIPRRHNTMQNSKLETQTQPKVFYDNMTRNMNAPSRNSWSYLLSHANKKQILQLKQSKRFCSSTSGYDSDFSNDTESGGGFEQDDMNQCKEDDYNMIEVKVKKNLPHLQSHRQDSSINLTGLVDRSIAQELRMQEIEDRRERHGDVSLSVDYRNENESTKNEVVITTGSTNAPNTNDPEFDNIRGIYCNQILCPTSSDVLTRYINYSSQTESEDLKTKIKCMTSENKELIQDINNNDNNKS